MTVTPGHRYALMLTTASAPDLGRSERQRELGTA